MGEKMSKRTKTYHQRRYYRVEYVYHNYIVCRLYIVKRKL